MLSLCQVAFVPSLASATMLTPYSCQSQCDCRHYLVQWVLFACADFFMALLTVLCPSACSQADTLQHYESLHAHA